MRSIDDEKTVVAIDKITADDARRISQSLVEFNASSVPFTQEKPFENVGFSIRNENGELIGGILGTVYCWNCLSVEALWIKDECRGQGLGTQLLTTLEDEARSMGCHLAHLDTFDFQAKAFYEKRGYSVFGRLDDCPEGHTRYYLKKSLTTDQRRRSEPARTAPCRRLCRL